MQKQKITFNGYQINKTEKSKKTLYDNSCLLSREDEVVQEAYKAANSIYPMYDWEDVMYGREDFMQDSAIYILEKFRSGYFDGSRPNLFPIIYRLIDGYFVYNKRNLSKKCATSGNSLNTVAYITNAGYVIEYISILADKTPYDPEDLIHGNKCLDSIIKKLNTKPFKTHKHNYFCEINGDRHELNEALVGALILDGKDLHRILSIFNCDTTWSGGSSKSAYIAKVINRTKNKILAEVKELSEDSRESVVRYLSVNPTINFL